MQFSVGDKVVHPGLGAGQITGVRRQELVKGFENYYVIEIPSRELTVNVPMRKMDELGVRLVMSQTKLAFVLDTLRSAPYQLPKNFKTRQEQIQQKLRTGLPVQVAEAVRDLTWHQQVAHSTKKDSDLLARARQFLAGEMALLAGDEVDNAEKTIDAALAIATAQALEEAATQEASAPSRP